MASWEDFINILIRKYKELVAYPLYFTKEIITIIIAKKRLDRKKENPKVKPYGMYGLLVRLHARPQ